MLKNIIENKKKDVLFITNIPAPYRVDFFNLLSNKFNLTVAYERERADDRNAAWFKKDKNNRFNEIYLNSIKYGKEHSLSFDVIKIISKFKGQNVVCGYCSLTLILAIVFLNFKWCLL